MSTAKIIKIAFIEPDIVNVHFGGSSVESFKLSLEEFESLQYVPNRIAAEKMLAAIRDGKHAGVKVK